MPSSCYVQKFTNLAESLTLAFKTIESLTAAMVAASVPWIHALQCNCRANDITVIFMQSSPSLINLSGGL
jgi:hypothetical protein